jgi:group I intron endonuclease
MPYLVKSYSNAEADKVTIMKENKNKSGVYMWTNLINGKKYIGSAVNLSNRLSSYYSNSHMKSQLKKGCSHIYNALLKHGHSNFSLTILEYCFPEKCIERENFYLSSLNHEYNILEKAGSSLGKKHSEETKIKMSDAQKGEKNPMFGKNHSDESKQIISDTHKGKTLSDETKQKMSDAKKEKINS